MTPIPAPAWLATLKTATAYQHAKNFTTHWQNIADTTLDHLKEIGASPSTEMLEAWSWLPHHAVPLASLLNTIAMVLDGMGTSQTLQAHLAQAVGSVAVHQRWNMNEVPPDLQRFWFDAIQHYLC